MSDLNTAPQTIWEGTDGTWSGTPIPARLILTYKQFTTIDGVKFVRPQFVYETLTHEDAYGNKGWERKYNIPGSEGNW